MQVPWTHWISLTEHPLNLLQIKLLRISRLRQKQSLDTQAGSSEHRASLSDTGSIPRKPATHRVAVQEMRLSESKSQEKPGASPRQQEHGWKAELGLKILRAIAGPDFRIRALILEST